jgi:hypothetical protein
MTTNAVKTIGIQYPPTSERGILILANVLMLVGWVFFIAWADTALDRVLLNNLPGLISGLLIFGVPIGAMIWLTSWTKKTARRAQIEAIKKAAPDPIEKYTYNGWKWGLAIAKDTVLVVHKGTLGVIPLSAIRKAWWDIPGYDVVTVFGAGAMGGLQAGAMNSAAKAEAKERSGFWFAVADTRNPLWFFHCTDAQMLRQWNEVLTQAFERAGLSSKAA